MAINLSTESMARTSAKRPWTVVGIWVVVFLVAGFFVFGQEALKDVETTKFVFTGNPEPKVGQDLLEDRLRGAHRDQRGRSHRIGFFEC